MPKPLILPQQGRAMVYDQQPSFAGGLNTAADPAALHDTQAQAMTNMKLAPYGAAAKRGGTIAFSTAVPSGTNTIRAMIWWELKTLVFAEANGTLYSHAPLPGNGAWSALTGSANWGTGQQNMAIFTDGTNEALYGVGNGTSGIKTTNGTSGTNLTWVLPSGASQFQGLTVFNDRLWGWSSLSPYLCYSPLATAAASVGGDGLGVTASGGGQIKITTAFTTPIITCFVLGGSLIICQTHGISRLTGYGQSDITVIPQAVAQDVNVVGLSAWCIKDNIGWVMTARGLYMVTESGAAPVGTAETPDPLRLIYSVQGVAPSGSLQLTRLIYNSSTDEVLVYVPGVGVYSYHTILQAWSGPWNGTYALTTTSSGGAFLAFPGYLTTAPYVLFSDHTGGCWQIDSTTYKDGIASNGTGGSAYTATLTCHRMFGAVDGQMTSQAVAKSWKMVNIQATITTPTSVTVDAGGIYGIVSTQTLPSLNTSSFPVPSGSVGPYLQVTISDVGAAASLYTGVTVEGQLLGRR